MNEPYTVERDDDSGLYLVMDRYLIIRSCSPLFEAERLANFLNNAFAAGREYERALTEKRIHEREEL